MSDEALQITVGLPSGQERVFSLDGSALPEALYQAIFARDGIPVECFRIIIVAGATPGAMMSRSSDKTLSMWMGLRRKVIVVIYNSC